MPNKLEKQSVKDKKATMERSYLLLLSSLRELSLRFPEKENFEYSDIFENCRAAFLEERPDFNLDTAHTAIGGMLTLRYRKQTPDKMVLKRVRFGSSNRAGGCYRYSLDIDLYDALHGSVLS